MSCSTSGRDSRLAIGFFHFAEMPLVHSVIALIARTVGSLLLPRKKLALSCDSLLGSPDTISLELRLLPPLARRVLAIAFCAVGSHGASAFRVAGMGGIAGQTFRGRRC
jgi:hypothetical protein